VNTVVGVYQAGTGTVNKSATDSVRVYPVVTGGIGMVSAIGMAIGTSTTMGTSKTTATTGNAAIATETGTAIENVTGGALCLLKAIIGDAQTTSGGRAAARLIESGIASGAAKMTHRRQRGLLQDVGVAAKAGNTSFDWCCIVGVNVSCDRCDRQVGDQVRVGSLNVAQFLCTSMSRRSSLT